MWVEQPTEEYQRVLRYYHRKKRRVTEALLFNLAKYLEYLRLGMSPQEAAKFGFVHNEGEDIYAVDQSGGAKLRESRLYFYIDMEAEVLYTLTIGDKDEQQRDVLACRELKKAIRQERQGNP